MRFAHFIEPFYKRLELKQQIAVFTDELANLVHKEQNAEIAVGLSVDIFFHFGSKSFHRNVDVVVLDALTNHVNGKSRVNLLGHLQSQIQFAGGKA